VGYEESLGLACSHRQPPAILHHHKVVTDASSNHFASALVRRHGEIRQAPPQSGPLLAPEFPSAKLHLLGPMVTLSRMVLATVACVALACGGRLDDAASPTPRTAPKSLSGGALGYGATSSSSGTTAAGGASIDIAAAGASSNGCEFEGLHREIGESFGSSNGCASCSCSTSGVTCIQGAVSCGVPCLAQGTSYPSGSTFASADGCNTCTCHNASHTCSSIPCLATDCTHNGSVHPDGTSFSATDGCGSQCSCSAGTVRCSDLTCACNMSLQSHRSYVATDVTTCDTVDFSCPKNTTRFFNNCGCGCEQSQSCPESFSCKLGNSTGGASGLGAGGSIGSPSAGVGNATELPCVTAEQLATCPLSKIL
jgi:hypothetical protein